MKSQKRKLKFAAIFGVCWFALLVLLVDGLLGFGRVKGGCGGSWAAAEAVLWGAVLVPVAAVWIFTEENDTVSNKKRSGK